MIFKWSSIRAAAPNSSLWFACKTVPHGSLNLACYTCCILADLFIQSWWDSSDSKGKQRVLLSMCVKLNQN